MYYIVLGDVFERPSHVLWLGQNLHEALKLASSSVRHQSDTFVSATVQEWNEEKRSLTGNIWTVYAKYPSGEVAVSGPEG